MKRQDTQLTQPAELRRKAEELEKIAIQSSKTTSTLSPEEIQRTLHELRVHQIQLEMQNEELRRIQLELDISRERYFDLYDLAPVGYCTLNEKGLIVESNLTLITLLGASRRFLVKMPFSQFIFSDDQPLFYQFRKLLGETKNTQECELRMVRADKSTFWVQLSATASVEKEESPTYRVVIVDITERKLVQLAIKQLNEDLENRVKLRTTDLENSNNAMKSFSYTVSHDLRAPLRAIDGFSSILATQYAALFDEEGRRLFTIIRDNVKKMNLLILDLLELAKVSNLDIKHFPINMEEMIHSVYWEMVSEDDKLRIQFKLVNIIDCLGDPLLIKQVWVNLIENAVKFSRKKDNPSITITSSKDKNQITYSIQDNGAGFNPEYKKKLFIAFSRLHADEEYKGTGIGLVLVDRIIQKHGGTVWAEGVEGQGATFYFSLPNQILV
jgi:PAS domain S-box-containing protein